jgi:CubicO group peptidase (beta-lactamase class C family)
VTITTRQLLAHLGGVVHYRNGPVVRTEREYDRVHPYESVILALDTFKESPLVCAPGEKHSYTTHGYILASAVVERAGEQKFAEQVRERIVEPLGMETLRPDYQWEEIPGRTVGYRKNVVGVVRSTDTDVSWKLGGGGFISNVEDLARLAAGLIGDDLLDAEMKEMMWTAAVTRAGETTSYGLGFSVAEENGRLKVSHSGAQEKTRTRLVIYPDDGHGVVVMTNSEHGSPGAFTTAVYGAINRGR